jgi:hypothetical protein
MAELPQDFGDRLVAREEVDPMRLEQLREQVAAVLELKLSRPMRWANVLGGVAMLVFCLVFVPLIVAGRWADQGFLARAFTVIALGGLAMIGAILIDVGRRGVYERRRHGAMHIGVAFLMCLGLGMALVHTGWSSADGQMVFAGTVLLVLGGAIFVMHVLEQYHLATKRKLLELELRLAELAERLERPPQRE